MQVTKMAVVLLILNCVSFAQTSAQKLTNLKIVVGNLQADRDYWKNQAEQLQAERDQLRFERDVLLNRVTQLEADEFTPITVGSRSFNTEQSFIDEFNRVTERMNAMIERPPIVISPEVSIPHIPSIMEQLRSLPPPPPSVYCFTNTYGGNSQTVCN